ncbi:MAG: cellobiose phosphorylase, partial [Candidatus Azambacteria bacterium]|nr:cellobiose phosphorylase [Candidatus Azambacteria bacterium]
MNKPRLKKPKYYLNQQGEFVIENYNFAKPLANFLPGIAGEYGIPMWVFYVNRGQGICSFGTKDKDHSIIEFYPANRAWQFVTTLGFRTFIKVSEGKKSHFYEPFHNGFSALSYNLTNRMRSTAHDLTIEEENTSLGISVAVNYFTIPQDAYAGLARTVTIKNTGNAKRTIQVIDGLPQIIPFGTSNLFLKKLGRTIEAWMNVENLGKGIPFYKLNVDPIDRPEVIHIKEGNFYLGFHYQKGKPQLINPIIDPEHIFGPVTDFSCPREFLNAAKFAPPLQKPTKSKTPCAFSFISLNLAKNEQKTLHYVVGYMRNIKTLNDS